MINMNPKVELFFQHAGKWRKELEKLRTILLDCQLTEELKWGKPCYTFQKRNVVIIYDLKEHCGLGFFKGALLVDTNGILVKPGKNSQAARLIKFSDVQQIAEMEPILNAYIQEAIAAEKAGLKVEFKDKHELVFPEEFQKRLKENPSLKTAFSGLTPGRQRAYNLYFSAPKQSKTRESRIEKCVPQILNGKGLNDCSCGLSQKQPYCDGSHKFISPPPPK